MKVTIVPIVVAALGTITKGLWKGLEDLEIGGRVEIIQTTVFIPLILFYLFLLIFFYIFIFLFI